MTSILSQYEKKIFSQNGEDGIITTIFNVIGIKNSYFVEFGVGDGNECNTRLLRENGWNGLWMDGTKSDNSFVYHEKITAENINSLFEKYSVPHEFDLLSIDIDSNDYWIYKAINACYSPRVIIVEYNASYPPPQSKTVVYDPDLTWQGTNYFGASLVAWINILRARGYSLVGCESRGVNAFFIKNELIRKPFTPLDANEAFVSPKYGQKNGNDWMGHRSDSRKLQDI
ncbi:hypothetical protein [Methylophaga sp.]|uniref:hypothetical protein n=1 Tax=Methylophaga sp. TaxID=2024840 RepID=UPI00271BED4B|nr:hypothetical protein [Methylophaga sp.]MDO8828408.1 hypothetical protein [Methylophaga sp.]